MSHFVCLTTLVRKDRTCDLRAYPLIPRPLTKQLWTCYWQTILATSWYFQKIWLSTSKVCSMTFSVEDWTNSRTPFSFEDPNYLFAPCTRSQLNCQIVMEILIQRKLDFRSCMTCIIDNIPSPGLETLPIITYSRVPSVLHRKRYEFWEPAALFGMHAPLELE